MAATVGNDPGASPIEALKGLHLVKAIISDEMQAGRDRMAHTSYEEGAAYLSSASAILAKSAGRDASGVQELVRRNFKPVFNTLETGIEAVSSPENVALHSAETRVACIKAAGDIVASLLTKSNEMPSLGQIILGFQDAFCAIRPHGRHCAEDFQGSIEAAAKVVSASIEDGSLAKRHVPIRPALRKGSFAG